MLMLSNRVDRSCLLHDSFAFILIHIPYKPRCEYVGLFHVYLEFRSILILFFEQRNSRNESNQ